MTVTMSLDNSTLMMSMTSNFFKVMNASGGVIGTWVSIYTWTHWEGA